VGEKKRAHEDGALCFIVQVLVPYLAEVFVYIRGVIMIWPLDCCKLQNK
jgi:hypothetical protein